MEDKNQRICIIGGGPAGTSAAMYLEKAGYNNYVIYEKTDHVGGKAFSPLMDVYNKKTKQWEKKTIEMGAVMGCDTYFAVAECEEFGQLKHEHRGEFGDERPVHDGPPMGRKYKKPDGSPYKMTIIDKVKKLHNLNKMTKLLNSKYKGYDVNGHRGVAQGRYEGLCPSPEERLNHIEGVNPNLKDLSMPFIDFLKMNKCESVELVWRGPFTSFGYGYFDEIPAAYVLKYLDAFTVRQFLDPTRLWTWYDGTQSIWEAVNKHLKHPALLNSEVTGVERKDGKVYVTVNGATEEFDKLIICTPLEMFLKYGDPRAEEKELFSKIQHKEYFTMAVRTADDNTPETSYYFFDHMTNDTLGKLMVFYHRWRHTAVPKEDESWGAQPVVTFTLRNHEGMEDVPYEKAKQMTLDYMAKCGKKVEKVERVDDWYYFPHVNSKDYADGWYDKVEAMQGTDNTYYAGEVMSFGDMEETVEYSKDLIRRFFK